MYAAHRCEVRSSDIVLKRSLQEECVDGERLKYGQNVCYITSAGSNFFYDLHLSSAEVKERV